MRKSILKEIQVSFESKETLRIMIMFLFLFLFLFRWNYDPCYSTSLVQGFVDGRTF